MTAVRHRLLSSRTTPKKEVTTGRKVNAAPALPSPQESRPSTQRKFDSHSQSSSPVGHLSCNRKEEVTMKRFMWLATLSLVVLMPFGMRVQAQPQEVTEAVTMTVYVTSKILHLEEGRARVNTDSVGMVLSDTASGLFHAARFHGLGGFTAEKGTYNDDRSWGVWNLQNGDKVFSTGISASEMKPEDGSEGKGIITFTGGTGTCAGIKGSFTFIRHHLRPAIEGIVQLHNKGTIKYTLP